MEEIPFRNFLLKIREFILFYECIKTYIMIPMFFVHHILQDAYFLNFIVLHNANTFKIAGFYIFDCLTIIIIKKVFIVAIQCQRNDTSKLMHMFKYKTRGIWCGAIPPCNSTGINLKNFKLFRKCRKCFQRNILIIFGTNIKKIMRLTIFCNRSVEQ